MRTLFSVTFLLGALLRAPATPDEATIKTEVENRYKEWITAASKKDPAAVTDLYDDNAVLMPKQEESVIGKAAIARYYKNLFADPHYVPFTATFESKGFHVACDIAIDTVDFEGELNRDGREIHFRGKTLLVWRRQHDGSWKIFRYMFDEIPAKR